MGGVSKVKGTESGVAHTFKMDLHGPGPGCEPRPQPAPSSVSLQSDHSIGWLPNFRELLEEQSIYNMNPHGSGPGSQPAPSCMSLQSDHSIGWLPNFREPSPEHQSTYNTDPSGTGSKPRLKSARRSKSRLPYLRRPPPEDQSMYKMNPHGPGPGSKPRPQPAPSCMSLQSDNSKGWLPNFRDPPPEDQRQQVQSGTWLRTDQSQTCFILHSESDMGNSGVCCRWEPDLNEQLDAIFTRLEQEILLFVKEQLQRFHRLLVSEYPETSSESEEEQSSSEAVLNITLDFLGRMKQEQLAERLRNRSSVGVGRNKLKRRLQQKFNCISEGVAKAGNSASLHQIYTELSMTKGGASEANQEHEVRHIETTSSKSAAPETSITCVDLFKNYSVHTFTSIQPQLTEELPIRTVLTKGVAGVGKTVLTQKFSLNWAEGQANQEIDLLFPFTFRELNVLKDRTFSLVELLHHFFSETKGVCSFVDLPVLFIFDGLDECRFPLDFRRTRVITDPTETASVEELVVNLIRGDLLPFAHVWITTRPAAASQIPAECVSMVTEVRGFSDPQKEQYFMKRITDKQQATAVISHIKSIRSLYIMCYIPIFCWILSTVLLHLMKTRKRGELPHTLTQMYIHFLVVQAKVKNIKYREGSGTDLHWTPETRKMVWSLGKLAFEQLMKGNLIFYENDLRECDLDAAEIARYSGVFTEVFREEPGLYQNKVYCFIHLTVQEILSALHVHQTFFSSGVNLLSLTDSSDSPEDFYRSAVDLALQSPNGHLDLFLRFLLGLSLPTNQSLLSGLLTQTGSDLTNEETVKYIKLKLNEKGLSAERSLNLLHCLNELNDHSLVEEIQRYMREGHFSVLISPAQWSTLSFLLLSSDSNLQEFDLRKYQASETVLLKLMPVARASTKAILSGCGLSPLSCGPLASVLSSSSLTHLDLSNNDLQDSGVELLCSALKSSPCRLETLRLSGCLVSEKGGVSLASALSSTPSALKELDLRYNHPGASAELLTALQAPHGPLDSLSLIPAGEQWMVPGLRKYSCEFSLDPNTAQRNLLLSEDKRTVIREREKQQYPDHADRFMEELQVLSSTGMTGRCYWEVQWSGERVDIAVSYKGIRWRDHTVKSRFGDNDQSWSLRIYTGRYYFCHNNREVDLLYTSSSVSGSGVVGVFLDSESGTLSFYEVRFGGEHIYTFNFSITEPLFPGFGLKNEGDSVSIVGL